MLGKLMKHEWKNICKVCSMLILVIIAVTVIGCIMLQIPAITSFIVWEGDGLELTGSNITWAILGIMTFMLYIIMLIGVQYGIMIYFGVRFYKTMYSEQGYLTNTLPVTAHQLLISKIVISGVWYLFMELVIYASIFALMLSLLGGVGDWGGYGSAWIALQVVIENMKTDFETVGMSFTQYGILMMLLNVIGPFTALTMLYGSLTLGQLSKKYKAVMGVVAYFGVVFINMIISTIVQLITSIGYTFEAILSEDEGVMTMSVNATYGATLLIAIIMTVILYISSHHILTKKLNMD